MKQLQLFPPTTREMTWLLRDPDTDIEGAWLLESLRKSLYDPTKRPQPDKPKTPVTQYVFQYFLENPLASSDPTKYPHDTGNLTHALLQQQNYEYRRDQEIKLNKVYA